MESKQSRWKNDECSINREQSIISKFNLNSYIHIPALKTVNVKAQIFPSNISTFHSECFRNKTYLWNFSSLGFFFSTLYSNLTEGDFIVTRWNQVKHLTNNRKIIVRQFLLNWRWKKTAKTTKQKAIWGKTLHLRNKKTTFCFLDIGKVFDHFHWFVSLLLFANAFLYW